LKKTKKVYLRLTESENVKWREKAQQNGNRKLSEFIRTACNSYSDAPPTPRKGRSVA
jgi:hypothetical protein